MCQMLTNSLRYAAHNAVTYGVLGAAVGATVGGVVGTLKGAFIGRNITGIESLIRERANQSPLSTSAFGLMVAKPIAEEAGKCAAYGFVIGAGFGIGCGITVTALEALAYSARVIGSGSCRCIKARALSNG